MTRRNQRELRRRRRVHAEYHALDLITGDADGALCRVLGEPAVARITGQLVPGYDPPLRLMRMMVRRADRLLAG